MRNGVVYGYLIFLVLRGTLGAAQFLLYFTAAAGFASLTGAMLGHLTMLNRQSLDLSAIREYLEAPECFAFETGRSIRPDPRHLYEIRLENVSFRYPDAQEDTLSGIDLTLHPGEKLAVVGLNGTGKTTLVKLICGFLDPTQGRVLFGGQDVRTFNRRDYYAHFAAVFQDYSVLAATVAENVAQTDQTQLDERRVWLCLEKAGLAQKIQSLPNGVQTHLGKQVYEAAPELSGGELQRLMLARGLYKDAPVLILDEPIAALDPIAETEIYAGFDAIVGNKTALYISHRLSSCRFCDKICVFDAGKIVQRGSHEQLVEDKGGLYFRLWQAQAQYYTQKTNAAG